MKQNLLFSVERETPGAVRYQEIDSTGRPVDKDQYIVGTLYLRKDKIGGAIPVRISVTIES